MNTKRCVCCGSEKLHQAPPVLWPALISEWELSLDEIWLIERQQGLRCSSCGSSLRSMALANAILCHYGSPPPFSDFARHNPRARVLEVNEAGSLTRWLSELSHHQIVRYPEVDMQRLPMGDGQFDVVVHSDTLEHVPDPVKGLSECRRVTARGGSTLFTVPCLPRRLSRSRSALAPSYHGSPSGEQTLVHTEFGADVWRYAIEAGFSSCAAVVLELPAAIAWNARH